MRSVVECIKVTDTEIIPPSADSSFADTSPESVYAASRRYSSAWNLPPAQNPQVRGMYTVKRRACRFCIPGQTA